MRACLGIILAVLLCCPSILVVSGSGYTDVTVAQAKSMVDSDPFLVVLDVRTQSEYDSGHIRNAKLIPLAELEERLNELNEADRILVYCMLGGRSSQASQILADNGFLHVYNMLGGIASWMSNGYPVYVRYSSLQVAVNEAAEGDTLLVSSGTYYEHVVVNKTVSLVGENRENTIIDGNGTGTVVQITSGGVSLSGFTIRKSYSDWSSGIALFGSNENCTITDNIIVDNCWGIEIAGDSNGTDISGNIIADNGQGIILFYGGMNSDTIIHDNMITDSQDSGIWIWSQGIIIINNSLIGNHHAIYLHDSANGTIYHNNVVNNTIQVFSVNSLNDVWDNGCEGNYWSNYNGTDSNGDGIGDTPYIVNGNNTDHYPLMNPYWIPADVNHDLIVNIFDVVRITGAYGATPASPYWNPHADIAEPFGKIDIFDVVLCTGHYGERYP